jgi:hypothetical protein
MKSVGTKKEVFDGLARKTSGGLTKDDLTLNKSGKVVSKRQQQRGKELYSQYSDVLKKNEFKSK